MASVAGLQRGVQSIIAPKVWYLEEELGLGRAGAVKVITGCPPGAGHERGR